MVYAEHLGGGCLANEHDFTELNVKQLQLHSTWIVYQLHKLFAKKFIKSISPNISTLATISPTSRNHTLFFEQFQNW